MKNKNTCDKFGQQVFCRKFLERFLTATTLPHNCWIWEKSSFLAAPSVSVFNLRPTLATTIINAKNQITGLLQRKKTQYPARRVSWFQSCRN